MSKLAELRDSALFREAAMVDGRWLAEGEDGRITVTDPADGEPVGAVPALDAAQSAAALDAAHAAWPGWAALLPQERSRLLRRWFELMLEPRAPIWR